MSTKKYPNYGGLTPRMRDVLELRVQGFSYKEIARKLGINRLTVSSTLSRALVAMQAQDVGEVVGWWAQCPWRGHTELWRLIDYLRLSVSHR